MNLNFADDNTLYSCVESLTEIKKNLIFDTKSILNSLRLNSVYFSDFCNSNSDFIQFMILGDKSHHKHILKINAVKVEASADVFLLGMIIDKNLTFKQHIENLCQKV